MFYGGKHMKHMHVNQSRELNGLTLSISPQLGNKYIFAMFFLYVFSYCIGLKTSELLSCYEDD